MNDKEIRALSRLPLWDLMALARRTKLQKRGPSFSLCTISNARSGKCTEDCAFCAQSARYHTDICEYELKSAHDLIREAGAAREAGATRFSIVTSGRGITDEKLGKIAGLIAAIREKVDINICASLGIMDSYALSCLKDAGLSRYHHNIETCRDFFPEICTTHTFDQRIETILAAREAGLEVCAGGLIGMGETLDQRISMGVLLADLQVDSVPLNILVPIKGTPLFGSPPLAMAEIMRTIAIFRVLMPQAPIRIAGGRDSIMKDFQGLAFNAGADAMLVGGYLTVKGRPVSEDIKMVSEIKELWKQDIQA